MNGSVLIIILLIATVTPFLVCYCLARFAPRFRYLPSILLALAALYFLIAGINAKPTGGGISGFGDMYIIGDIIAGLVFLIASAIAFLLSFVMHWWRRTRHDQ